MLGEPGQCAEGHRISRCPFVCTISFRWAAEHFVRVGPRLISFLTDARRFERGRRRIVRCVFHRTRSRADDRDHVRQYRGRLPRWRPLRSSKHDSARQSIRRCHWCASRLSRSRRFRSSRYAPESARRRRSRALPGGGGCRCGLRRRYAASARQATRRAVQHGRPRR